MRKRWKAARPAGRFAFVAVLAVVLAGAGTAVWWFVGRDTATAATPDSTTTTVEASTTTMEKTVSASGTLTPTVQDSVSFEVSGTVTAVDVAAGDTVTAGQVLATVDTLELNADLLDAKATLASAQAKLADLKADDDGTTVADAQIAAASAQVDVAQSQVDSATEAMSDATLVAPDAGLVTAVGIEVGDRVSGSGSSSGASSGTGASSGGGSSMGGSSSSSSSSSSSAAFTIVGTDAYTVSLTVDDSEVANIALGDQVEMTSDDLDGTVYGVVDEIGLLSTSSGVASYPVVVQVTGDVSTLHDGISVDAEIIYERRTDVLAVPSQAITTGTDGTTTVTKVNDDGTTETVTVTTGETSGTMTEITDGLAEGDQVQVVTYTRTSTGDDSSGSSDEQQNPWGDGEMPDFSQMGGGQGGGQMPGGGEMPQQMGQRNG
jgi:macrolide-specific efflux system membrane fusion protein